MVAELWRRFTPVQLHAVQSSLFHDRRQRVDESVDQYAQDLRILFHKAYLCIQQGIQEAESLGYSVLTGQFVSGLCSGIRSRVIGIEGSFEQLLSRARFEEAKLRDIGDSTTPLALSQHQVQRSYKPV